ncbi:thiamine pyrophosphate-dependent dehydrogenase E1 component subunit alpha [Microbispora cellulosiformans]|uniref:Thiamine pyrophosphate-dependent dehydrogenase E1 component subunit alpha n=1 Tax=Microbispora cellulosiformans TaxID=2614688 RepID=A0A5J5JQS8_9ACTN|nr:thiamine pyrophosphate-dependent dehydrogenase E1 component subunit alpha [Microbispora cellulosiformans]KAA9373307.1 thiamine pyrophosphate-dependent dehydrogenase E1 component subunit alpha [Microbispora cellulosiformans]
MTTRREASVADAVSSPEAGRLSRLADGDLRMLLLIRHFEQALLDLFGRGQLNGTTHTCIGQEYVPVALRPLLSERDFVFSNHRGHGHYLARFGDPHDLLAEVMGRAGAVCNGVGGSQHIRRGRYLSTGVQGQSLPVAVGTSLHLKTQEEGALTCAYIGDGTWGEGAVYEALNMAALWRVPLLVAVENNGIAQSTPTARHMAGTIAGRARAFGLRRHRTESLDVNRIRAELAPLIREVRLGRGPLVVEFVTHRVAAHSKGDDTRPPGELERVLSHDWYRLYAAEHPGHFAEWDDHVRERVAQVVEEVTGRPMAEVPEP